MAGQKDSETMFYSSRSAKDWTGCLRRERPRVRAEKGSNNTDNVVRLGVVSRRGLLERLQAVAEWRCEARKPIRRDGSDALHVDPRRFRQLQIRHPIRHRVAQTAVGVNVERRIVPHAKIPAEDAGVDCLGRLCCCNTLLHGTEVAFIQRTEQAGAATSAQRRAVYTHLTRSPPRC